MVTQKKTKPAVESYFEGIGRRKTAIARVRIFSAKGGKETDIIINEKDYQDYFKREHLIRIIKEALQATKKGEHVKVTAHVSGGGIHAQAQAIQHGIARALVLANPEIRKELRSKNLLTRDPRMKERRKFGLKKARRAPQWSKR